MQCPQCGLSIDANAAFCPTCGWVRAAGAAASPLAGAAAQAAAQPDERASASPPSSTAIAGWAAALVAIVVVELALWSIVLLPWLGRATRHWNHAVVVHLAGLLVVGSIVLTVLAVLVFSPLSTGFFAMLDHNSLKDPDDYGVSRRRGLFGP